MLFVMNSVELLAPAISRVPAGILAGESMVLAPVLDRWGVLPRGT